MFIPHYELSLFDRNRMFSYQDRWRDENLTGLKEKIWHILNEGGSKHRIHELLSSYIDKGIEKENDLRGFDFWFDKQTIYSDNPHSLRFLNVAYSKFWWGKLQNWTVFGVNFSFTELHAMEFENCWFDGADFYGAVLEDVKFVNCEFVSRNDFTRCAFYNVKFENCYFSEPTFTDCKFDEQTYFNNIRNVCSKNNNLKSDNTDFASFLKGIKEGYQNGDCSSLARNYYYQQMKTLRLYNTVNCKEKLYRWLFEKITGYGVKPQNTLLCMLGLFLIFSMIFMIGLHSAHSSNSIWNGLLLSAGSFFTFGAYADLLKDLPDYFKIIFILESALGITLLATFITVLANFWTNWEK